MKLLALTYMLEKEAVGSTNHLRSQPVRGQCTVETTMRSVSNVDPRNIAGFHLPSEVGKRKEAPESDSEMRRNPQEAPQLPVEDHTGTGRQPGPAFSGQLWLQEESPSTEAERRTSEDADVNCLAKVNCHSRQVLQNAIHS